MATALRIALEIKADPALIDAITALAAGLGVALPARATASDPASPPASSPVPRSAPSTAHIAKAPPPLSPGQAVRSAPLVALLGGGFEVVPMPPSREAQARSATPIVQPPPTGTTLSQVRDAARLLNDKVGRPALVAALAAHSAQSLANLPEAAYEAFVSAALQQVQES